MLKALLIGFGYWGPNLARNIANSDFFELKTILDSNPAARAKAKHMFPQASTATDLMEIVTNDFDVAFIATPASTHIGIAQILIEKGLHLWIEKPATLNLKDAEILIALQEMHKKVIVVDHPYAYSPAVETMALEIKQNKIGKPLYFESQRANLGIFQPDVNVLWDLAVHDLSILLFCVPEIQSEWVSCITSNPLGIGKDSIANLNISFHNSLFANISCNWLSPIKIRRTFFIGNKETLLFDDNSSVEKLKIYSQEFTTENDSKLVDELKISFRSGNILSPRISPAEPLRLAIDDFANAISKDVPSRNDLRKQIEILTILELAQKSANQNGQRIYANAQ
jgi:predicted dehydrogenase